MLFTQAVRSKDTIAQWNRELEEKENVCVCVCVIVFNWMAHRPKIIGSLQVRAARNTNKGFDERPQHVGYHRDDWGQFAFTSINSARKPKQAIYSILMSEKSSFRWGAEIKRIFLYFFLNGSGRCCVLTLWIEQERIEHITLVNSASTPLILMSAQLLSLSSIMKLQLNRNNQQLHDWWYNKVRARSHNSTSVPTVKRVVMHYCATQSLTSCRLMNGSVFKGAFFIPGISGDKTEYNSVWKWFCVGLRSEQVAWSNMWVDLPAQARCFCSSLLACRPPWLLWATKRKKKNPHFFYESINSKYKSST